MMTNMTRPRRVLPPKPRLDDLDDVDMSEDDFDAAAARAIEVPLAGRQRLYEIANSSGPQSGAVRSSTSVVTYMPAQPPLDTPAVATSAA